MTSDFFVKTSRGKHKDDAETWVPATVAATLNGFDNTGSVRATTLIIFYGNRVDDIRLQKAVINTLQARMGTGGNNMPMVLIEEDDMEKNDKVIGTLQARDYKGVGNQYVDENKLIITYPIQDGREMNKNQNGMGVGDEEAPSYTLDQTGSQAVAYSIREDAKANTFSATEITTARSLSALQPSVQSHHAQTFIVQPEPQELAFHMKQDPVSGDISPALGTTTQGMGYMSTTQVRRLTPLECERLQGFPDNWTDGQADSSRYKQMGNAVAVPVVEWIINRLVDEHMKS